MLSAPCIERILEQARMPRSGGSGDLWWLVTMREVTIAMTGLVLLILTIVLGRVSALVVLITSGKDTLPFPDMEAAFAPRIPAGGITGVLHAAIPLDACLPLENAPVSNGSPFVPIAVAVRGDCSFETKVLHAQDAGFSAVIVFNDEDGAGLVSMSGRSAGIHIPALFVSKTAGETLLNFSEKNGTTCYILPSIESTTRSLLAASLVLLLTLMAVSSIILLVRRYRLRRVGSRVVLLRESCGMTAREVKLLPLVAYKDGNNSGDSCAICLEDYATGEKLRVLPCNHEFHALCIDHWLTTRRSFCPICKRDARSKPAHRPPSECTPLLPTVPIPSAVSASQSHHQNNSSSFLSEFIISLSTASPTDTNSWFGQNGAIFRGASDTLLLLNTTSARDRIN